MKFSKIASLICEGALAVGFTCTALAQVNVTTWHNDLSHTGANTQETILTPSNVSNSGEFGQLFSVPLDGAVYGQPLYLYGQNIGGGIHNMVFVATEHDSVYAIDADSGTILWQRSFLESGMTSVPSSLLNCGDITPEIGITGTPVIDPSTGTMYFVTATEPGPVQKLHSIDVLTGQDKLGGAVTISASVPGTGVGSSGGNVAFSPLTANQRAALTLTNGHVIVAWGSHCDRGAYHGWIMSFNANTLAREALFMTTPDGNDGGIWMSGGGPSVDADGNIYFGSSNGDFSYPTSTTDFGDTIFKFPQPVAGKSWAPLDGFAPWNQSTLSSNNEDVGAGAELLLPDLPAGSTHQQLMITAGKLGEIFVLDRNHLGYYCSTCSGKDTNIVQEITGQLYSDMMGSAAYWNGRVYFGQSRSTLKEFSFNTSTGAVSSTAMQASAYVFNPLSPTPEVSSNGNSNGIVWVLDAGNSAGEVLLAYNATNLSDVLAQLPVGYPGTHFSVPTVVNGKVYAGSNGALVVFGLLNTKPVLTITASNVSAFYNQPIPPLTGYTATGFEDGDNSSVLSGAPSETTTAVQGSPAGTYPINISQGTLAAANYTFAFVSGTLTISGSQSQSISFPPIASTTYGAGPVALDATASSGLPVSYSVTGPATLSGSTLTITGVGAVSVTATQAGNNTYSAATPVTESFTVNKAPLTITAASVSVLYNNAIPALTGYTATGFVGSDNSSVLSGAPSETTTAVQGSPAGTYPITITQGSLAAANYTFSFVNGTLTISGNQSQTITFNALPNVNYGTAAFTLSATASSGLPVSYTVTGPATVSGSTLSIGGAGVVSVTARQAGNSSYAAATPVTQSFTVNKAPLTITAANVSVPYNSAIPALTGYTATGFVGSDNSSVLSGAPSETTTAVQGSPAGTYPITITQGSLAAANYTFSFVNGTLTINAGQSQTITFNALPNVNYGTAAFTLSATASSGLPVSYTVTGPATVSGSTLSIGGAGVVSVTASQAGNSSYAAATPVTQSFTVNKAPLTVTAANVSIPYNSAIPALTGYTATGFVGSDNSSVLSGAPSETTTAVQGSPAGTYPITITQGSLAAANYTFSFVNGTLTINAGQSQTITFPAIANTTYGAAPVVLNATASSGLPVSYSVSGPATLTGSSLPLLGAGVVSVTATQPGNSTYAAATPVTQSFTVNKAPLTITAANATVAYNQPIPALTGYTATGFVGSDTTKVLSGAPAESTTAVQGSPAGTYPITITQGSLAAANYTFGFVNGSLTISNSAVQVGLAFSPNPVPASSPVTYTVTVNGGAGQPNPVGTVTLYGISNGQPVQADGPRAIGTAGTGGSSSLSVTLSGTIPAGTYSLFATFRPASGSPYPTTNSPQAALTFQ